MHEKFKHFKFRGDTHQWIDNANAIIAEYTADRLTLTLRQLYYQFVARNLFANSQKNYKKLGQVVSDGRLAGLIDWEAIEDRTRDVNRPAAWDSEQGFITSVGPQYAIDMWEGQTYRPEVWVEKGALVGILERACEARRVPYYACRGYNSQSEQYAAGRRFADTIADGQIPIVLYLGDHDPSGLDMSRDHVDRLEMFAREGVDVRRLALNHDQVQRYNPPPNPAKMKDSRAAGYVKRFGRSSWELDALNPRLLHDLITNEIEALVDQDTWDDRLAEEQEGVDLFRKIGAKFPLVKKYVGKLKAT